MNTHFFKGLFTSLLLSLNFVIYASNSNIEWMNGYIITHSNDTIHGILGYRNGNGDWRECLFKNSPQSEIITYIPEEIISYGYEKGLTYVSKEIDIPHFKKYVFIETLLTGNINLYYLKIGVCPEYPDGKSSFIAEAPSGKMIELKEDKNLKTENITRQQNRAKLNFLFTEYPELKSQIDNIRIDRKSLIKLFSNFHKIICADFSCVSYKEKNSPRRWWITPQAGAVINHYNDLNGWHPGFAIGSFVTTNLSKFSDRFVFNIGLELNTSPDYLYWTEFPSSKKGWSYTLTNFYTIESRVMNGTARPFFEIGVHHGYFIAQQYKAKNAINVYNWGIIAGIGMYLHLKKCELPIRIRYCYGNKVDMATLTIGYTFKLK